MNTTVLKKLRLRFRSWIRISPPPRKCIYRCRKVGQTYGDYYLRDNGRKTGNWPTDPRGLKFRSRTRVIMRSTGDRVPRHFSRAKVTTTTTKGGRGGTRCKRRRLMETRGDTLVTSSFCVIIAHVRVVFRMSTSNNARRPRWNEFSLGKEKEGRGRDWLKERRWPPFVSINYYTRVCFSTPPLLKKRKRSDSFLPFVDNNFLDTRYIAYIYCN